VRVGSKANSDPLTQLLDNLWSPARASAGLAQSLTAPLHPPFPRAGLLGGGSGFLRSAAITAAGIAGGALLFEGIQSMFGHQDAVSITGDQPVMLGLGETVANNHVSGGGSTDGPALAGYGPDLSGSEITDISTPDFSGNNASS